MQVNKTKFERTSFLEYYHMTCIGKTNIQAKEAYREEKTLRHVAMVAKFLDDNKPIKSLKKLFVLFQTLPILFSFI